MALTFVFVASIVLFNVANCQYAQQQQHQQQPQQQQQTYGSRVPEGKVQLDDIERDNVKGQQPVAYTPSPVAYTASPVSYTASPAAYTPQPEQQSYVSQAAYSQVPISAQTPSYNSPQYQQQYVVQPYFAPQSIPYQLDFSQYALPYPLEQSIYQPYMVASVAPQVQSAQLASAYKVPSQIKQSSPVYSTAKAAVPQLSNNNLYYSSYVQQPYYQPAQVLYTQSGLPQTIQYVPSYQPQTLKSIYSSGIKSTTPSAPLKGRESGFTPVASAYQYELPSSHADGSFSKVRLSG